MAKSKQSDQQAPAAMANAGFGGEDDAVAAKTAIEHMRQLSVDATSETRLITDRLTWALARHPLGALLKCDDLVTLVHFQKALAGLKDAVDALAAVSESMMDMTRKKLVPTVMESEGIESIRIADVGRVQLNGDLYVSVIGDARILMPAQNEFGEDLPPVGVDDDGNAVYDMVEVSAWDWLIRNGSGDLIKETVNASSLKAVIKAKIRDGVAVPPELFKMTPVTYSSIHSR